MGDVVDLEAFREAKKASEPPPPCPGCHAPMLPGKDSNERVWVCCGCLKLLFRS